MINEICGGNGVSATYVSQCCAQLDTLFEKWRNRPIPPIAHLFLDATYTKVRRNEIVSDCAVFVAAAIVSSVASLASCTASINRARSEADPVQNALLQGELELW